MFIIYLGAMGSRAVKVNNQRVMPLEKSWFSWLVVSTPPKNISQLDYYSQEMEKKKPCSKPQTS